MEYGPQDLLGLQGNNIKLVKLQLYVGKMLTEL